ncbi:MAG: hypothetical protein ACI3W5_12945 [Faecousia sp.]
MKEFEVTLTALSKKTFKLSADSRKEAMEIASQIWEDTDLLAFRDEDVVSMEITATECCGGVCESCENACEYCGGCTEVSLEGKDIEGAKRCPVCGNILWDDDSDE